MSLGSGGCRYALLALMSGSILQLSGCSVSDLIHVVLTFRAINRAFVSLFSSMHSSLLKVPSSISVSLKRIPQDTTGTFLCDA